MRGFDEAAVRCGVESVRTLRGGYLASSGLTVPRVDNARRAVEFALGMRESVQRFNARTGASLDVRAGVDTGAVTSGVVARASLAYDLWGDAVSLASRLRRSGEEPGVFLTDAVRTRIEGLFDLEDAGTVHVDGRETPSGGCRDAGRVRRHRDRVGDRRGGRRPGAAGRAHRGDRRPASPAEPRRQAAPAPAQRCRARRGPRGLLVFATRSEGDLVWPRVVATVFGFLVILLLLSVLNVALFATAERGTWRERVPTIFVEIARLLLVVIGLGFLFQWVWGADVGGLITALGVTSIVIGLALQRAAGGIVSGLLVLFEQPFRQGDWIETGGTTAAASWRSTGARCTSTPARGCRSSRTRSWPTPRS